MVIRGVKDAPKYKEFIRPLIFAKRLCDVFDDEVDRIAKEVSKPFSTYDIIVAEVESVMGKSLHDLEASLNDRHPEIARYSPLSELILTTSALLQGYMPNQSGAWDMDKKKLVEYWEKMENGLVRMANFLKGEGIYDEERLPTNAVLAVIAALCTA